MCYPYCMGILYVYNLFIRSCILYTMMDFQNEVTKYITMEASFTVKIRKEKDHRGSWSIKYPYIHHNSISQQDSAVDFKPFS